MTTPRRDESAFFWEGTAVGELRAQRCAGCAAVYHPPRPSCAACGSYEFDHVVLSGQGTVVSHATVHRPLVPPHDEPFVVGLIELEQGVRLVAEVVAADPAEVAIGVEVHVEYVDLDDGRAFPRFRHADDTERGR